MKIDSYRTILQGRNGEATVSETAAKHETILSNHTERAFVSPIPYQGLQRPKKWAKESPDIQTTGSRHAGHGRSTDSNTINDYINASYVNSPFPKVNS